MKVGSESTTMHISYTINWHTVPQDVIYFEIILQSLYYFRIPLLLFIHYFWFEPREVSFNEVPGNIDFIQVSSPEEPSHIWQYISRLFMCLLIPERNSKFRNIGHMYKLTETVKLIVKSLEI
jgi:hypothetical protein